MIRMQTQGDGTKLLQKTKQTRQKYLDRFENMQGKQVKRIPLQMNLQNCCYKEETVFI